MSREEVYEEMQKLYFVKQTQIEMVRDRGYDVSQEIAMLTMSFEQFVRYIKGFKQTNKNKTIREILFGVYHNAEGKTLIAFYASKFNTQVNKNVISSFTTTKNKFQADENILIINAAIACEAKKDLIDINVQIFEEDDLTFNPTAHVEVPRHERLSKEEAKLKLKEMKAGRSGIELIRVNDPIVRYFGWQVGDVIRVYRDDSSLNILTPYSINYRMVYAPHDEAKARK